MDMKTEHRELATADHADAASVSGSDDGMGSDYRVRDLDCVYDTTTNTVVIR